MRVDTGCIESPLIESPLLDLTEIDLNDLGGLPADSLARSLQHALRGVREGDGSMASFAGHPTFRPAQRSGGGPNLHGARVRSM